MPGLQQSHGRFVLCSMCVCVAMHCCSQDRKSGIIRFTDASKATQALSAFEAKPDTERTLVSIKATMKAVTGDEEKDFHKRVSS